MPAVVHATLKKNLPHLELLKVYKVRKGPDVEEEIVALSRKREKGTITYRLASVTYGITETTVHGTPEYEALLVSMGFKLEGETAPVADAVYDEDARA